MKNHWNLEKIKAKDLDRQIKEKIISIPKYQRGIVWNKKKQDLLIETIKKGLPFGSILIHKDDRGNKQLIDGLQRSSTIFEFINNPSQFFNEDDIEDKIIHDVFSLTGYPQGQKTLIQNEIRKNLIKWIRQNKTMINVLDMETDDFVYYLSKELAAIGDNIDTHREIKRVIKPIFDSYKEICRNMLEIEIPVIELFGDEEILPEVFERINSTGATLSKYQIFSAAWSTKEIKITEQQLLPIIDYVSNRYDSMTNGEIEIDGFDSTELKKHKIINIFDLCYGFGKLIKSEFPYLFGSITDNIKVESVGFNIINAALIQRVNNQKNLHMTITKYGDAFVNQFLIKLLKTIRYVDRILNVVTQFKGNTRKQNPSNTNHTEYQIVSIIAYVFIKQYGTIEFDEEDNIIDTNINLASVNQDWSDNKEIIVGNIIKTYIIDVLNENWRGSGDKKLDNIILNEEYYLNEVNESKFEREIDSWFNTILDERKELKKIKAPKEAEKVFLNMVYSNLFSAKDQLGMDNFDIEHLFTKSLMKDKLSCFNPELKLPISSIGNLCYLPEQENRSKGRKTLYDDMEYINKYSLEELEQKFTFTEREDFDFLNMELSSEEFRDRYISAMKKRYDKMKSILINNIFHKS